MPSKLSLMVEFAFLPSRSAYFPSYNKGSVLIKIATLYLFILFLLCWSCGQNHIFCDGNKGMIVHLFAIACCLKSVKYFSSSKAKQIKLIKVEIFCPVLFFHEGSRSLGCSLKLFKRLKNSYLLNDNL